MTIATLNTPWAELTSADKHETIVHLVTNEGRSYLDIADMFPGATRSAIAGVVNRLEKLTGERIASARTLKARRDAPPKSLVHTTTVQEKARRARKAANKPPLPKRVLSPEHAWDVLPGVQPVELTALGKYEKACRWPHGDLPFTFCNQPVEHGVYCEAHRSVAYTRIAGE
jgi:hypothetical protein